MTWLRRLMCRLGFHHRYKMWVNWEGRRWTVEECDFCGSIVSRNW